MSKSFASRVIRGAVAALAWGALGGAAVAASADIANTPIDTAPSAAIRPNVMFVLDDSLSMLYDFLPETTNYTNLCYGDSRINRLFYDPTATYLPPLKADGSSYPDVPFNATVPLDGFNPNLQDPKRLTTTANLLVLNEKWGYSVDTSNPGARTPQVGVNQQGNKVYSQFYYARYNPAGNATCSGNGYDYTKFTIVTTSASIAAPAGVNPLTNYANWYSYYRTRMLMMRSAAGRAFSNIDATRFRVGFSTIHETSTSDGNEFLNIRDFDAANPINQKVTFFSKLYGNTPNGGTPLRPALLKAGKYFANKVSGQTVDPVQYSCQRNYTILSTDGYWNKSEEGNAWNSKLTGGSIGNQDGPGLVPAIARPQLDDVKANGNTGGPGVSDSLADIAMYFYKTDLRDNALGNCGGAVINQNVCTNNVAPVTGDPASFQHMNTITLGLGVSGKLVYDPNYNTQAAGDYFQIVNGTKAWPDPKVADATNSVVERVDDLWHAAVNGRGKYYSANDPVELANSLADALAKLDASTGAGAAAATSNLQPVAGDNYIFVAKYQTQNWSGNLEARTIDPATGTVNAATLWNANTQMNAQVAAAADTRNIYFFKAGVANNLASFTYANLTAAGLNASFDNLCPAVGVDKLTQCGGFDAIETAAATGTNLVNYLRGQSAYESTGGSVLRLFRERIWTTPNPVAGQPPVTTRDVLGDIVSSVPVYVKKPAFTYVDAGYEAYATANAARQAAVYTGANDGMLHAFNADTGAELWAYVPTLVMPTLYELADFAYPNQHQYYADGGPTLGDVYDGAAWHTVLVGGFNKGGKGYYALDVTNPAAPKALWEFSDADLGYSYGNPVITKLKDGTWVVVFSSGYNNSGAGFLYVRNALTGAHISKIPTNTGTALTPSNLGAINVWVDHLNDNTAKRVYAGDMLGNLWRFDIDDNIAPGGNEAFLLAQARLANGTTQPITTRPELSEIKVGATRIPLVSIGTGRYLGASDIGDTSLQSVYTFKDVLTNPALGNLHAANSGMVPQTLAGMVTAGGQAARTIANPAPVDWSTKNGWYVDLSLSTGERVNVDMYQQRGILTVATNVPETNACAIGGSSWLYYFDVTSGSFMSTSPEHVVSYFLGNSLVEGLTLIKTPSGIVTLIVNNKGELVSKDAPPPAPLAGGARRVSWRELVN